MKSEYSNEYADRVKQLREELIKKIVGNEYERKFFKNRRTNGFINFIENLDEILDLYSFGRIDLSGDVDLAATFEKLLSICDNRKLSELQQIQAELEDEDLTRFQDSMVGFKKKIKNDIFYKQSHVSAITDFSKMSDEEIQEQEGIDLENRAGVKIYTLNGIPFYMFVHKGAYAGPSGTHGTDQLSVSMISDKIKLNTIGASKARRLLVFNSINTSDIIEMGTQDLGQGYERHEDVLREQKMMIDEFLNNVTNVRGIDYTDYSIHTLYTEDGKVKPEGKLQPDSLFIRGEVLPEDIEYAKSRGIANIYSYQEEIYEEKSTVDEKEFKKILSEYAETLDPNLLAVLRNKTAMKSEEFVETIKSILLSSTQKIGNNTRGVNVNARTLINMFNYEKKRSPELQAQIEIMGQLEKKPDIELESGSDEEKKFLEIRQKEAEQKRLEEKKEIIARLKKGIEVKDGDEIVGAISEFLQSSINIEEDFMYVLNFAKNNTDIIRQTNCFASVQRVARNIILSKGWMEQENIYFQNYMNFGQMYRDSQNPTRSLENIEAYFGIGNENIIPNVSTQAINGVALGKEVLSQVKDAQGRRNVREELNAQVHALEQKQPNDKQEIGD